MIHSLRAFHHRNFRLFFYGQSVSLIGTWTQQIAMLWLVYRLTHSAFLLGVTGFASQIAILVFAPFGGIWSDRLDRRRMLLVTQSLFLLQGLILALLTYTHLIQVWHVIAMALLLGLVMAFDTPIRQAFLPQMVPSKADLPSAIAFNAFMQNAGRLIGPTIAGFLIAWAGEGFCFLLNGISKFAVIAAVLQMAVARHQPRATKTSVVKDFAEGVAYCWNVVPIRMLLPLLALVSFMASPYATLMPIFAKEVFHGGAKTMGFLIGAAGFGALVGMIWLAARKSVRGLSRMIICTTALAGISLMVFSYSRLLWLALPAMALAGFGIVVTAMSVSMILQTIVDDDKRGRVMSFFTISFLGMTPLGSLAAGALASAIGAPHTLAIGGACCVAGAWVLRHKLPQFRIHLRPIYVRLGIIAD
ncbi:MAG TPA: MFS transporter [Burkholderiales bacterium]|jgi:MFS family permease|nr:MFS transporter [Burkholderiales bacterium]